MSRVLKGKVKVECLGMSASKVTQSIYQIKTNTHTIILDYGLYQSSDIIESYIINTASIKEIEPKKIDYIIISHANIDHCGALPVLYKKGCIAPTYVARGTKALMRTMLYDSAKIMESDIAKLEKNKIKAHVLYTTSDIERCLSYVFERDFNSEFSLCNGIMCELTSAHHIVGSAQVRLTFNFDGLIKRIHYTGDIGSPDSPKLFVDDFTKPEQCDLMIGECTYSDKARSGSEPKRSKDMVKIEKAISSACLEHSKKVLFPVFALDRLQTMLATLYQLYEKNGWKIPVIVDTPLGHKICQIWGNVINCDHDLWDKIMNWNLLSFTADYSESIQWRESEEPIVVLASSGMCTNGRSVDWVKTLLPNEYNCIVFCGYSADDTIATAIKKNTGKKIVSIEDELMPYRCSTSVLNSFSSHAHRKELMKLYTECQYNRLLLVHSDFDSKCVFAEDLKANLSKANRTSQVIIATKGMSVNM